MTSNRISESRRTIAHFMPWSGIGGVEIATLRLVDATRDRFRHVAFCLSDATALVESFHALGVETRIYTPPVPSLRHAGKFIRDSATIARELRATGVDVVHFSDEKAAHHNSLAALIARTHTLCHLRVSYPHLPLRQRLCLKPIDRFVFVSKENMDTFCIPLPKGKGRVIYDAVEIPSLDIAANNESVREELGIAASAKVVGTVARISAQKDYRTLAAAATEVLSSYPETIFLIVGDNSLVDLNREHYSHVLQDLKDRGIADRFIFTGHRQDVPRLVAAMDISVLCTHREGFPLSILESMAMQKPVVATAVGGIPEIVLPDVTGYLHRHEDSNGLAAAIMKLIGDPGLARRIGRAAYEHVKQNYSRGKFIEEISRAYSDVMES
jgi:glycosyltransferase involved in cell wall biosynthesis